MTNLTKNFATRAHALILAPLLAGASFFAANTAQADLTTPNGPIFVSITDSSNQQKAKLIFNGYKEVLISTGFVSQTPDPKNSYLVLETDHFSSSQYVKVPFSCDELDQLLAQAHRDGKDLDFSEQNWPNLRTSLAVKTASAAPTTPHP